MLSDTMTITLIVHLWCLQKSSIFFLNNLFHPLFQPIILDLLVYRPTLNKSPLPLSNQKRRYTSNCMHLSSTARAVPNQTAQNFLTGLCFIFSIYSTLLTSIHDLSKLVTEHVWRLALLKEKASKPIFRVLVPSYKLQAVRALFNKR